VSADGLERNINSAGNSKPSTQSCDVHVIWAQVVKNDRFTVQKRLNVDEFPGPPSFLEDALAHREAIRQ
jgi:hypothetical protein